MTPLSSQPARPLRSGPGLRYRAAVVSRTIGAIGGGYLLAALGTQVLALVLPLSPVDRVVSGTLTGLVLYPCAVMWSFAAATAVRAWLGLAGVCALLAIALLALHGLGGQA